VAGEDVREPLDRVREAPATLEVAGLGRQLREQVAKALLGDGEKAPVAGDSHDCLGHAQRDDLRVCDPSAGVSWLLRQEIVSRAINGDAESVEVGVHRGLLVDGVLDTADFGLSAETPSNAASAVESII
jgi:hypothetical protein